MDADGLGADEQQPGDLAVAAPLRIAAYQAHNDEVRRLVAPHRLIE